MKLKLCIERLPTLKAMLKVDVKKIIAQRSEYSPEVQLWYDKFMNTWL